VPSTCSPLLQLCSVHTKWILVFFFCVLFPVVQPAPGSVCLLPVQPSSQTCPTTALQPCAGCAFPSVLASVCVCCGAWPRVYPSWDVGGLWPGCASGCMPTACLPGSLILYIIPSFPSYALQAVGPPFVTVTLPGVAGGATTHNRYRYHAVLR